MTLPTRGLTPEQVKRWRRNFAFSTTDLADAVGMHESILVNFENRKVVITNDQAASLKSFFSFVTRCADTGRL